MWYDKRSIRLLLMGAIYALGAFSPPIYQAQQSSTLTAPSLSALGLYALLLPLGFVSYVRSLFSGVVLGVTVIAGLIGLPIWIMRARDRTSLVTAYVVFFFLILLLARGVLSASIAFP
jgi:hypothetical protein